MSTSGWKHEGGVWESDGPNKLLWQCEECGRKDPRHPATPVAWVGDDHSLLTGIGRCSGRRRKAWVDESGNVFFGEHPEVEQRRKEVTMR